MLCQMKLPSFFMCPNKLYEDGPIQIKLRLASRSDLVVTISYSLLNVLGVDSQHPIDKFMSILHFYLSYIR